MIGIVIDIGPIRNARGHTHWKPDHRRQDNFEQKFKKYLSVASLMPFTVRQTPLIVYQVLGSGSKEKTEGQFTIISSSDSQKCVFQH